MSDPVSISALATPERRSREAIAQAAQRTGVNFDYLLAQAKLESSLNPGAKARTSSATGLYQFIGSTWLETLDKHGDALGFAPAAAAIENRGGRATVSDPAQRQAIMALRFDPHASALMAGALASDNRTALTGVLGREPDVAELYLAHFLGAGGASRMLGELQRNPDASAAALLPGPAAANRGVFYAEGGRARSVGEVMQGIRTRIGNAMEGGAMEGGSTLDTGFATPSTVFASYAQGFNASAPRSAAARSLPPISAPQRPASMADTLRSSFAAADSAMPERSRQHIAGAYARLKAFDL